MPDVEFDYVEIKNYRQYVGTQRVNLSSTGDRRINIIEGQNGAGKSNFLNAISLCFYGEEAHGSENSDIKSLPYANHQQLQALDTPGTVDGYIEIQVTSYGTDFIFRREFQTTKDEDGNYHDVLEELELYRLENQDLKMVEKPNTILNDIIPSHVWEYFIFDGEYLNEFFKDSSSSGIRKGVVDVSQVELIDRSIYHLEEIQHDLESEAAELGGETKELTEEKQELENKLAEKDELIDEKEKELEASKDELERKNEKLQDAGSEEVIELRTRRENLRGKLETIEERLESEQARAAATMLSDGPGLLAVEAELETLSLVRNASPSQSVPTGISKSLVENILEREICICGTPLEEHEDVREHLQHLKSELDSTSGELLDGQRELPEILEDAVDAGSDIRNLRMTIRDLEEQSSDLNEQIADISNELKQFDIPDDIDVAALEQERTEIQERISMLERDIGRLENKRDDIDAELDRVKSRLKTERRKDRQQNEVLTQLEFVETALTNVKTIRERIIADVREDTERYMEEYFNALIWKDDRFQLSLSHDYEVTLTPEDGSKNLIGSLSAGERQVLALSYTAAISQLSGYPAPVVIDTPLGRISSKPRKLIAQNLPKYLEDMQMTLLVTDEEYTREVKGILSPHVANEYKLDYHDGVTEVATHE